ncbi:MAG: GUN4 domain-containing protein, partial [Cyanobacteria bacterium J06631_2]
NSAPTTLAPTTLAPTTLAPTTPAPSPTTAPEVDVPDTSASAPETPGTQPNENPEVIVQPEVTSTPTEVSATPEKPKNNQPVGEIDSENISSVPTLTPNTAVEPEVSATPEAEQSEVVTEQQVAVEPEVAAAAETKPEETPPEAAQPKPQPEEEVVVEAAPVELEEVYVPTVSRKIALVSPKTGIDYTQLRNLLKEGKWSEADIHTYKLVGQIVKSAKLQKKQTFIELKTIAEYSCPDVRTVDYLWKKYSDNQFGFSQQQQVWRSVNQEGDFSTKTWRRFATEVGWKKGEVENSSGYLLYDQLDFEPAEAPAGHLPWWFALPDESQKVIKYLFARCNLNPTDAELEAEARQNSDDTAQNPGDNSPRRRDTNQPDINKPPKSPDN